MPPTWPRQEVMPSGLGFVSFKKERKKKDCSNQFDCLRRGRTVWPYWLLWDSALYKYFITLLSGTADSVGRQRHSREPFVTLHTCMNEASHKRKVTRCMLVTNEVGGPALNVFLPSGLLCLIPAEGWGVGEWGAALSVFPPSQLLCFTGNCTKGQPLLSMHLVQPWSMLVSCSIWMCIGVSPVISWCGDKIAQGTFTLMVGLSSVHLIVPLGFCKLITPAASRNFPWPSWMFGHHC